MPVELYLQICRTVSCVESAGFARTSVSVHENVRFFYGLFMYRRILPPDFYSRIDPRLPGSMRLFFNTGLMGEVNLSAGKIIIV